MFYVIEEVTELRPPLTISEMIIGWLFIAVIFVYLSTFIMLMVNISLLTDYRKSKKLLILFSCVAYVLIALFHYQLINQFVILTAAIVYIAAYTICFLKIRHQTRKEDAMAQKTIAEHQSKCNDLLEQMWQRSIIRSEERLKKFADEKKEKDASDYNKCSQTAVNIEASWTDK